MGRGQVIGVFAASWLRVPGRCSIYSMFSWAPAGLRLGSAWAPCILQDFVCGGGSNQASGSKS